MLHTIALENNLLKLILMKNYAVLLLLLLALFSCKGGQKEATDNAAEDLKAKKMLQGIWLDDESDEILFKIQGDTIYYPDAENAAVYFKIKKDTLYTYGKEVSRYKIDKQADHIFWFHSLSDNIVKLHKSEDENDSFLMMGRRSTEAIPTYTEVTKRDSVVMYNGKRYRAYVYVNPSKKKVVKTSYSDDGISIDNVYYDNVMHICVYEGRKMIYGHDITKDMFSGVIPAEFLKNSILSDMDFYGVGKVGFRYQATVCIPESSVCNLVNLIVSFNGKLSIKIAQ
jgi:hypothetical protein